MKIVTLVENLVYQQGLQAEHGFSLYVESAEAKILFDTGQSDLFVSNARKMGIAIEQVDILVLSHGHYDHTGGLYAFLEINKKAVIYAKPGIFAPKYRSGNRFIGTLLKEDLPLERFRFVEQVTRLTGDIFLMPEIMISYPEDTHLEGLFRMAENELVPDLVDDELFMAIRLGNKIHILTACSHKGITNICTTAKAYFNLPVGVVLGGFHLKNATSEQITHTIQFFNQLKPNSIGVGHCTGVAQYGAMAKDCQAYLFYNYTGKEVNIN